MMSSVLLRSKLSQVLAISVFFLSSASSLLAMEPGDAAAVGGEEKGAGRTAPRIVDPYEKLSTAAAIEKCAKRMEVTVDAYTGKVEHFLASDSLLPEVIRMLQRRSEVARLVKEGIETLTQTPSHLPVLLLGLVDAFSLFMRERAVTLVAAEGAHKCIADSLTGRGGGVELSIKGCLPSEILALEDSGSRVLRALRTSENQQCAVLTFHSPEEWRTPRQPSDYISPVMLALARKDMRDAGIPREELPEIARSAIERLRGLGVFRGGENQGLRSAVGALEAYHSLLCRLIREAYSVLKNGLSDQEWETEIKKTLNFYPGLYPFLRGEILSPPHPDLCASSLRGKSDNLLFEHETRGTLSKMIERLQLNIAAEAKRSTALTPEEIRADIRHRQDVTAAATAASEEDRQRREAAEEQARAARAEALAAQGGADGIKTLPEGGDKGDRAPHNPIVKKKKKKGPKRYSA